MKHIKEFKLENHVNEGFSDEMLTGLKTEIRNYILGKIIDDHEFTDVFLDKKEVQDMINFNVDVYVKEVVKILDKGSESLGKVLLSVLPK